MLKPIYFVILTIFISDNTFSQDLVIDRGRDIATSYIENVVISCGKDTVRLHTESFVKPVFHSDEIVDIHITGRNIQPYYNQFTQKQWIELDTIVHYSSGKLARQTPVIFFDKGKPVLDHADGIDKEWLEEYFPANQSPVRMAVFSASKVSAKDRKLVEEAVADYLKTLNIDPENIRIIYEFKPYISGPEDYFSNGSEITEAFIKNQNTPFMREQANKYALVIQLQVILNKMDPDGEIPGKSK